MPKEINEQYGFGIYIDKVLKQVHPDKGITADARSQVNNLLHQCLDKIIDAVSIIKKAPNADKTLTARDVQTAVRLTFPGELAKHAVGEGTKATTKAYSSTKTGSKAKKAGLQFPPSRVENVLRLRFDRISDSAPVYVAGVLEYITAEIVEISGNAARDNGVQRLTPRHLFLAVHNDEELLKLFHNTVLGNGVMPNIQRVFLPRQKSKPSARNATYSQWKRRQSVPPFTVDQIQNMKNSQISQVCKDYKIKNCTGDLQQRRARLLAFFH